MKTLLYRSLISTILFIGISQISNAQYYSGKFRDQPHLSEFNHVIVMQNDSKNNKSLSVKAIANSGELWHSKATPTNRSTSSALIAKFGTGTKIRTVYTLTIPYKSESWKYYLLGYKNDNKEDDFMIVEGVQDDLTTRKIVEVHTFDTSQITASAK